MIPTTSVPLAVRLRLWAAAQFGPGQPPRQRRAIEGVSEGAAIPTAVDVTGGKGDNERRVVLLSRFDGTALRPLDAARLGLRLIAQAAREVVGV
ncbi:hypothetical protein SEA_BIGGITYBASS_63 [Gordonia phage BiggityBass]|nr:hypothetical protein SEA_BIGGITYBASS_63 [Gordonia phage BiggityBass]